MTENKDESRTVTVERRLDYPPERVWRALTEPQLMAEWLMRTDFAPEVGRHFTLSGDWGTVEGEVLECEPPSRLAYRWQAMGVDTVVTFTLAAAGAGTLLRMEQAGFRADQQRELAGAHFGWEAMLGKLDAVLAGAG